MIFYNRDREGRILAPYVWNPKTESPMAVFENGRFSSDSLPIINNLLGLGYVPEENADDTYLHEEAVCPEDANNAPAPFFLEEETAAPNVDTAPRKRGRPAMRKGTS